ncbi:MAG: hypothetical protein WCI75_19080, partial [candidate division NC10 bacterium]
PSIQAALLIAGLIVSIVTVDAILRTFHGSRTGIRGVAPQAVIFTAETIFLLWLYLGASA